MGRPVSMTDSNYGWNWAQGAQYDYASRLTSLQYMAGAPGGTPAYTTETMAYNTNGQMVSQNWSTPSSSLGPTGGLQYSYSATRNNGQITQTTDTLSGETIGYQYDALKRLMSAASTPVGGSTPTAWTQNFQYDGFGNLTAKVLNGTSMPIAVNGLTNQLSNANYDLNGNMTSGVGATLTYDSSNRMLSAAEVSGGTEYYGYSPDNKRMYRLTASGTEEWTFYGGYGEKLGVFQYGTSAGLYPVRSNVYFAGRTIVDDNFPVFQDRVGTNRANGARFMPFGDEITSTSNDREKFATYTRDSYTGLDYADQRFYASTYGRFNAPDPDSGSADPSAPGSWNRYSYTLGDPVNGNDPSGLDSNFCLSGTGLVACPAKPAGSLSSNAATGFNDGGSQGYCDVNPFDPICTGTNPLPVNPGGGGPPPPGIQLTCEIGLFYRKAFNSHLPWNHTYLAESCTDGNDPPVVVTIQADPGPVPKFPNAPRAPSGYLGPPWLVGVIGPAGTGPGQSNPSAPGNYQVGGWEPISSLESVLIGNAVLNYDYNYVQPYTLFPYSSTTYNSNSFIYTLDTNFGLNFSQPSSGRNPGWGNLIPNLGP
jgi:RHS repeat-associated protein